MWNLLRLLGPAPPHILYTLYTLIPCFYFQRRKSHTRNHPFVFPFSTPTLSSWLSVERKFYFPPLSRVWHKTRCNFFILENSTVQDVSTDRITVIMLLSFNFSARERDCEFEGPKPVSCFSNFFIHSQKIHQALLGKNIQGFPYNFFTLISFLHISGARVNSRVERREILWMEWKWNTFPEAHEYSPEPTCYQAIFAREKFMVPN